MAEVSNFITGGLNGQSDADSEQVLSTFRLLGQLVADRQQLNMQMEEVSALILPAFRGTFQAGAFGVMPIPYAKKTDQQIDSTGMLALDRFMAICDSLLTPKNQTWHGMSGDAYLMKDKATRTWYYNTTRKLFKMRYANTSGFVPNNQGIWTSLGAFGNGVMYTDKFYDLQNHINGLRYTSIPFGEIYLTHNHQGVNDGYIRIMRYTAEQALKRPEWKEALKDVNILTQAAKLGSQQKFIFLQHVCPRDDYDPSRLDYLGMPYASYYIMQDTRMMISKGGYNTLPISATRYIQAPGELNGRSIAMSVLPALKTLNAEKKVFLKQGHRAADPVILLPDGGLMNANLKPGAQNAGGMNADGKRLVDILPSGEIQISKEMMGMEIDLINDAFLIKLFAIAADPRSGTTATEVIEKINEKGILIAPTLGRQEGEYLGNLIHREIDLLAQMGELDPFTPAMREAKDKYTVTYDSPLSRASRAQEAAGFMRTVETTKELVNITGDVSLLDQFDFDTAIPAIAQINAVPEPWMASPTQVAQKRQARAKAAQTQQQIQAAPAAAGMIKAQAAAAKAGVGPAQRNIAPGPGQPAPGSIPGP